MANYNDKKNALLSYIDDLTRGDIVLAFSGGVDSSLLLKLCCESARKKNLQEQKQNQGGTPKVKVYAVTLHTKLHPPADLEIARRVALETGADEHIVLYVDELAEAGIGSNPVDRCYLCKKYLFGMLLEKADELQASHVLEGTNEDDLHVYRPGIKAVNELGVLSPLARCHITKDEVRMMAAEYGISVSNRPSTPCMATRFPYGTMLNYETMQMIAEGEEWLKSLGFYNVRLRVHGNIVRIEVDKKDMPSLLEKNDGILNKMSEYGFDYVTLDLAGFRSGSMDVGLRSL